MTLAPNQALLHYRLVEKIGAGGMGQVWKAFDTVLGREVAVKFLPAAFAADPDRLARFEREAKLLATLNHPGIAAVYGLHEIPGDESIRFIAMELVPGEDLAERLASGALETNIAIDVARQIADALEAAHDQGVIHRDLKPANVKLTPDGKVKILDLGLAKAFAADASGGSSSSVSLSPTVTSAGTMAGMLLGTAAYMSPEQARGHAVDRRADIWAFGAVFYEMLTGRSPFQGDTITDVLAAVVHYQAVFELVGYGIAVVCVAVGIGFDFRRAACCAYGAGACEPEGGVNGVDTGVYEHSAAEIDIVNPYQACQAALDGIGLGRVGEGLVAIGRA